VPVSSVELIGRSLNATSVTRQYYLHGPADESEVYQELGTAPQFVAGLPLADISADEEEEIAGDWRAQVTWGVPDGQPPPPQALNTVEYRFNFQAPSAHITQSLETIRWAKPGGANFTDSASAAAAAIPVFDGAINVVDDGGKNRVEGIDLAPAPEVFTLNYATETGFITRAYQILVESMVGHVNESPFFGCDTGTLLLARVSGGKSAQNAWNIEFGFSFVSNATDIPVGENIVVDEKEGHDLLWVYYTPEEQANYYGIIPRPEAAYVERIWPRADFNDLDLPT
jgi:hypothetical protein